MVRFLSCSELYDAIQKMSLELKDTLWVCSPYLGSDAHQVFSQEILKNPPADIRFVFRVNDVAVKRGEVNPYEVQYFMEHFKNSVKSNDNFHSKIYIFDKCALVTSANLTKTAFENNVESGVLLEGPEVDEVKSFFEKSLWQNAKPIKDVKKYTKMWNVIKKSEPPTSYSKKTKAHTKIKDWSDDYVDTWYFVITDPLSKKAERKIKKETNWSTRLSLVGDIGPNSFKQLKLGDLAFIANLNKKRGKIEVELARIFDKSRVETDEGDLHFAYDIEKTYLLERDRFYDMLKRVSIGSKTCEIVLNKNQVELMTETLSPTKHKKTKKS
jgi:hypothetical protein